LDNDSEYTIFAGSTKSFLLKWYKVKEVVKLLEADGWVLSYWKGDHRQFKHAEHTGKGTSSDTLMQELLNSIWHLAGWK